MMTTTALDPTARRLRMQLFVATWLSYAGYYLTRKVFSVVKGPIRDALHVTDLEVSYLFSAYLVTYMLGQFLAAASSRRFANRTLLLVGMSVSLLCNLVMGAALSKGPDAYSLILVTMAVHGFAQAVGWPCNVGLMANWTRHEERGTVMALWGTCYQLGAVAGKAFASFVFGWLGLAWSFWASSLALGAFIVVFFFWAREKPETSGLAPIEEGGPAASGAPAAEGSALPNRNTLLLILALGVIYFAFKGLRYAVDSWSALMLAEQFSLSTERSGYLSAVFDWVGFVGVIVAGWLSDRVFAGARMPVVTLMTAGCLVASILLWQFGSSSVVTFVVLLGAIGFLEMGPDSLVAGAGAMDAGSRRHAALAAGIINGCGSLGPIVQEPLIGWLKMRYGIDAVLIFLVVITLAATLGAAVLWMVARRLRLAI